MVFTPSEERQLTLPERHDLLTGTRRTEMAFELKAIAQERLRHHGWNPESTAARTEAQSEVSGDALPLPSPRVWRVYATVSAAVAGG